MGDQTIIIDISPAGSVKIEAEGFRGSSCEKATQELELVLGGGTAKKSRKPEYSLPPMNEQQGIRRMF